MKAILLPVISLVGAVSATPLTERAVNCNGKKFDLSIDNWNKINADQSLQAFWHGGTDAEGTEWPGASSYRQAKEFTTLLGTKLQNKPTWNCSGLPFETSCDAEPCTAIGKYNKNGKMVSDPSRWGLLAINSVINLHKWISLVYNGINIGQGDASNAAFGIATDFVKPKEKPNVLFKDLFAAAAAAFGILGGLPAERYQPWGKGANAVAGLINTELALHLQGPTAEQNFQTAAAFSQAIQKFADQAREGLETANDQILNSADDTTLKLLGGGQWINAPNADQTDIARFFRRNMVARGINAVWRQYPVYLYYVWLDDAGAKPGDTGTKCDLDRSGPQSNKYCANEGVYYLYLWNGHSVDWPYGGPALQPDPYNINPIWAVESSARSFKAQGINYDPGKTDTSQFLGSAGIDDYINSPERLEGTWTLPVCDGSSFGQFNFDYEGKKKKDDVGLPPCVCGIDGRDTADFVRAANLDAKDVARSCFNWWTVTGTDQWPTGADSIAYGLDGKNKVSKSKVEECRKESGASNPKYCEVK